MLCIFVIKIENMDNQNLAKGVKVLRKAKGLSQEELAENSGLSLRTIQRVENKETEPSVDTLKRISTALDITHNELLNWNKDTLKRSVKTKYEYLHIFNNKLVISKTSEINDLVKDYGDSVNNVFKTLMVFFISIPIFSAMAAISYNLGITNYAIYSGAFAFILLVTAFYTLLFTSGSSIIKIENISKIKIKKVSFYTVVLISHMESGRQKERSLILEKNQVENMKTSLLSERLIEEKDIKLKRNTINIHTFLILSFILLPVFLNIVTKTPGIITYYNGAIMLFISVIMIIKMVFRLIFPVFKKTTDR